MVFDFDRGDYYQFLHAIHAMITVISPGMTIAWSAVALPLLTKNDTTEQSDALFYDNPTAASWFASIISLSCPIGCYLNTILMRTGRKIPLVTVGYACTAGWVIMATSYGVEQLIFGRFIVGIGTGLVSAPTAVYVAEIASPKYRLCLLNLSNFTISLGILLIYVLGYLTPNWKTQAAISSIVPLVSATSLLIFLPESPVWLLHKNEDVKAKLTLMKLRGIDKETAEFMEEFNQMVVSSRSYVKSAISGDSPTSDKTSTPEDVGRLRKIVNTVKLPEVWKPFLILNTLFFVQNFSGIYVIVAYTVDFLTNCGVSVDPFLITMTMGIVQLLSCTTVVFTSHKVGVRKACLFSTLGMSLAFGTLVLYLIFLLPTDSDHTYQAIPIGCLFVYVATGFYGLKSMPWSIVGELYPTVYTHYLTPLTTCNASIFGFVAVYIYPSLVSYGFTLTVSIYFGIAILAMIFIAIWLPETRGITHHDIVSNFQKK